MVFIKNIQEKLFLAIAFFLGTWGAVYNIVLTILIGVALLYNIWKLRADFIAELKKSRYYIGVSVFFLLYISIHTLVLFLFFDKPYKPSWGTFEACLFFFLLISLYVVSVRTFMSTKLLKQFLGIYCLSVFTFNFASVFYLGGGAVFTDPIGTISNLYSMRFGGTKEIFGGFVYLDAQALNLSVAVLISWFFLLTSIRRWEKITFGIISIVFLWFLSLTVTKSPILALFAGFLILNLYIFKKLSLKYKGLFVGFFVLGSIVGVIFLPDAFVQRWNEAKNEVEDVMEGNIAAEGFSITPRVAMFKACLDHVDEFALFGFGVYTNPIVKQWFLASDNKMIGQFTHCHNSYLQYWMIGGVVGLLFIFSWFVFPLWRMIRDKRYSYFVLAVIVTFFIDNNSAVLLIVNDSTSFIIFFLAMFYFYRDYFYALENNGRFISVMD